MIDSNTAPLRFGWTILHVPDVSAAVAFYERAFGMQRRFVDPQSTYAELQTGTTTLAFAAHEFVRQLGTHSQNAAAAAPEGFEIALVAEADLDRCGLCQGGRSRLHAGQAAGGHALGSDRGLSSRPERRAGEICTAAAGP